MNPVLFVVITAHSDNRQSVINCDHFQRRNVFISRLRELSSVETKLRKNINGF